MSCGKLHEPGEPFHLHPPGEEHGEDEVTGAPEDGDAEEEREPGLVRRALSAGAGHVRTAAAGAWAANGYLVKPFGLIPATEGTGWFIHQALGGSPLDALIAAGVAGAAGEVASEVANHRRSEVAPVRVKTRQAVGAATGVVALAGAVTVTGPFDIVQWAGLVIAALAAGRISYEKHKAHPKRPRVTAELAAPRPEAIEAPPVPDPRMMLFGGEFCGPEGPLARVAVSGFRDLPAGFLFELSFAGTPFSPADVERLVIPVAKLYGVRKEAVSIDYIPDPDKDNENFCQVIIRKLPLVTAEERSKPKVNRWPGISSWDPERGTFDIGKFTDQAIAHYRAHKPRSGAMMGMFAGVPDAGKSGTLHVLGAETGLASLCSRCGRAGTAYSPGECERCDPRRVMAVWMGDAQAQSMSVWRGRADMTGWGVEGCLGLLELADAVYEERGRVLESLEWWDKGPDGRPRHNTGRGWWDVAIGWPHIAVTIDEWPLLIRDPDEALRKRAQRLIVKAVTVWRKRGLELRVGSQDLDMGLLGVRELREIMKFFTVIAHRLNEVSSNMGGITGNPMRLSPDMPGAGYISGIDRRPGSEFTTKYCPEANKDGETGIDIRHLAGIIGQTPIQLDPGYQAALGAWGIDAGERMVFTEWRGRAAGGDGVSAALFPGLAAVPSPPASAVPRVEALGTVYREDAEKVRAWLRANPGPRKVAEIMQGTDLTMGPVKAACAALVDNGQAERAGDREFQAA